MTSTNINPLMDITAQPQKPSCAHFLEEMTKLGENYVRNVINFAGAQFQIFLLNDGQLQPITKEYFESMEDAVKHIKGLPVNDRYMDFTILPIWRSRNVQFSNSSHINGYNVPDDKAYFATYEVGANPYNINVIAKNEILAKEKIYQEVYKLHQTTNFKITQFYQL